MKTKMAKKFITWTMIVIFTAVSVMITPHVSPANEKEILMKKGIYDIEDFFNLNSTVYFGIKIDSFFEQSNLSCI